MDRLGLFLFFDDEGSVDKYIEYLLDDIIQNIDKLVIICNGTLNNSGRDIFKKYTRDIIIRPNVGFDAGGFKDGINYIGWNELEKYDEIILFNDSFFGPLYSFNLVFEEMEKQKEIDFWGLSAHGAAPPILGVSSPHYVTRPKYLQTYFLAFRKKLVCSDVFHDFWNTMPEFETFNEVAANFGPVLTQRFKDSGFQMGVYSDTSDLESDDITKNISHHTFNLYEMITKRKFPILKRKTFVTPKNITLQYNSGNDLKKTMDYIERYTTYDTSLIYQHLLRKYNLDDIKKSLNLLSIVSDIDIYEGKKYYQQKRIALFLHTFYPELFDYDLEFLKNVPSEIDLYITNSDENKIETLRKKFEPVLKNKLTFIKVESRGRDLSALLVGCRDYLLNYDYICFIHDKKSSQKENMVVGASFRDLLWENMLFSPGYISNILNRFEEHPCLGLQVPPNVYHGSYFGSSLNTWTICFEKTYELAYSLGISVPLDKSKEAFATGTVFWARTTALKALISHDWSYRDFPAEPLPGDGTISHALERILPYVAQFHGYYTEYVLNPQYASSELMNFRTMHNDTVKALIGIPRIQFKTHMMLIQTLRDTAKQIQYLYFQGKKNLSTKYQKYLLSYTVSQYLEKKLPLRFFSIIKRFIKIPNNVVFFDSVGVKGALSIWINDKGPIFLRKVFHKFLKV